MNTTTNRETTTFGNIELLYAVKNKIFKPQSLKDTEEEVFCGFRRMKREKGRSPKAVSRPDRQKKKYFESSDGSLKFHQMQIVGYSV